MYKEVSELAVWFRFYTQMLTRKVKYRLQTYRTGDQLV